VQLGDEQAGGGDDQVAVVAESGEPFGRRIGEHRLQSGECRVQLVVEPFELPVWVRSVPVTVQKSSR